jgi:hypothetical protein
MSEFIPCDLDGPVQVDVSRFDVVLMLDVIEHMQEPERFLIELRNHGEVHEGTSRPLVVISTPNVAFAAVRLGLLLGRFNYAERGILDITHRRLFTRASLLTALRDCGFEIHAVRPVPAPWNAVLPGRLGKFMSHLSRGLCALWPTLFAFQFLVECTPKPGVRQVLRSAQIQRRMASGDARA